MSTYSDAWRALDNDTRDFYRNFALVNTSLRYTHSEPFPGFPINDYDWGANWTARSQAPWNAYSNWTYQLYDAGEWQPATVQFVDNLFDESSSLNPTLPNAFGYVMYQPQLTYIPAFAIDWQSTKKKPRRCHWTGAPRRRMNL